MIRQIVALRHVAFEDLGTFADVAAARGIAIVYREAGIDALPRTLAEDTALAVLGGPIGAYEEDRYPFLLDELRLIDAALAAGRPVLGICLGAQLLARALGARVYPGKAKEIGFAPVTLTPAGEKSCLGQLAASGNVVLHWHGDTFDLPAGTERLAETPITPNQAFSRGPGVLGLQFHPELRAAELERWLIGHTAELSAVGIDPRDLRRDAALHGARLEAAARAMMAAWFDGLGIPERAATPASAAARA
ncbi:glutamine amidotransferase [Chelatococcus sp. SYSU_G07232]|uniref:Glutamine amidotransferase n=1 Tax=Chelatococcus albus TaxID=3047466 RepID=A0ABT7AL29_9HYPH|nr:glutamine amidotransferase [Chelatococcus sp. SYSU_G07232]MDJ1159534.1 glutamine amidotransferase [Chelatococcus sp. SYSU_G07232]